MTFFPTSMRSALVLIALFAVTGCDAFGGDGDASDLDASERLFPARQNGDRVLIDQTGRVVVDLDGYNSARAGSEGLTPARRRENNRNVWDYFDASGEVAFSIQADEAYAPRNGRARVRLDNRWAFVDTDGAFIINPYLRDARNFSGGLARVKTTGNAWGFLDRDGDVIIDPTFGSVSDFRNGRARFESNGKAGFIDETGEIVIPAVYDDARDFSDGRAAVRQGQRWSYIDLEDNRLLDSRTFISAGDYAEGLAPVRTENKWEYVNESGDRQIDPVYDSARAFVGGRAAVEVDGQWTFIRADGTPLRAPEFDEVEDFAGGLAEVTLDGKQGYIDLEGATVWIPRD